MTARLMLCGAGLLTAALHATPAAAIPPGEYFNSCRGFNEGRDSFTATCRAYNGRWVRSTVHFASCRGRVYLKNINGVLRCQT